MTVEQKTRRVSTRLVAVVLVCVLLLAMSLVWAFLGMRSVMDVGGACADGGPYVSAQPCPDGTILLTVAIPLMMITAMGGTVVAAMLSAPNLLIPMWGLLFGSLGWNFLEYGFADDGLVWGWIICGVVFELMALPALFGMGASTWVTIRLPSQLPGRPLPETTPRLQLSWYAAYVAIGAAGAVVGWWTFDRLS